MMASVCNAARWAAAAAAVWIICAGAAGLDRAAAQGLGELLTTASGGDTRTPEQIASDEAAETAATLATITQTLRFLDEKTDAADELRKNLERADTDVDKASATKDLEAAQEEIAALNAQIEALATGVSEDDLREDARGGFDLEAELEQLIQPFILMLKSATENARAIETLKRSKLLAERTATAADEALARIAPLAQQAAAEETPDEVLVSRLGSIADGWRERRDLAVDRAAAAQRQLEARLAARADPRKSAEEAFQSFFSERGRNLAFGFGAFFGVFAAMRLLRRGALAALGPRRNRTVPARVGALMFDGLTILAAFGATLAVFNLYNDWLLTGLTVLLLLALGWFVLRSAPSLFEQVTLLLNLGAVQEGERVMLDGVPWRVRRLDFYTDLENPSLCGGDLTLPIRKLAGLHSRPTGPDEAWFPSEAGDVVQLQNGFWGEVVFQSPEMVRIKDDGGAIATFTTEDYLAQTPRNLSAGYEARASLRLDYEHSAEATGEIPDSLRAASRTALEKLVPREQIAEVAAELVSVDAAALNIEISARMTGAAAARFEDVSNALTQSAVACAAAKGWRLARHPFSLAEI